MSKKILLAVLLTFVYMLFILMINTLFPHSELRFIVIGMGTALYLLIAQKLNKKLFRTKA